MRFQLERFRVGGQFYTGEQFGGGRVNDSEGAFTVPEPGEFGSGVEAQVVGVGQRGEVLKHFEAVAAEESSGYRSLVAIGRGGKRLNQRWVRGLISAHACITSRSDSR